MSVEIGIEVYGLKEAIKSLNSVEPGLRNEITRDYRRLAKPVIQDAKRLIPNVAPLSGMERNWTSKSGKQLMPWLADHKQPLKASINTRKISEFRGMVRNVGTFVIRWGGPLPVMFDSSTNGKLGRSLTQEYGKASRVMWPALEKNQTQVMTELTTLVEKVMDKVNRNVVM